MKSKILAGILAITFLSLITIPLASAQIPDLTPGGSDVIPGSQETFSFDDLISTANQAVNIFVAIIVVASILLMVWGGFTFIMSGGDPGKVKDAKNRVVYGLVGVGVMILAVSVFNIISTLLD